MATSSISTSIRSRAHWCCDGRAGARNRYRYPSSGRATSNSRADARIARHRWARQEKPLDLPGASCILRRAIHTPAGASLSRCMCLRVHRSLAPCRHAAMTRSAHIEIGLAAAARFRARAMVLRCAVVTAVVPLVAALRSTSPAAEPAGALGRATGIGRSPAAAQALEQADATRRLAVATRRCAIERALRRARGVTRSARARIRVRRRGRSGALGEAARVRGDVLSRRSGTACHAASANRR